MDLRTGSATHLQWVAVELTADNRRALYIPGGIAHGFHTLADDTEMFYQMSEFFCPAAARELRWDDPELAIAWPLPVSLISKRD